MIGHRIEKEYFMNILPTYRHWAWHEKQDKQRKTHLVQHCNVFSWKPHNGNGDITNTKQCYVCHNVSRTSHYKLVINIQDTITHSILIKHIWHNSYIYICIAYIYTINGPTMHISKFLQLYNRIHTMLKRGTPNYKKILVSCAIAISLATKHAKVTKTMVSK